MVKKAIPIVLACLLVSALAMAAKLQIVRLKGIDGEPGGSIIGEVQETEDGYNVRVGSKSVITFTRDQVESIEDYLTPADEYLKRRKEANQNEPKELLALARWGYSRKNLDVLKLALEDLDKAMKLVANYEEAELLARQINAKINKLTSAAGKNSGKAKQPRLRIPADWLVSKEDILRIRLAEVKIRGRDDRRIGVVFHNDLIDRFLENMEGEDDFEYEEDFKRFRSLKSAEQLREILDKVERDDPTYADDIEIRSDPKVIRDFRSRVWPIVRRRCASRDCHGSPKTATGGLKLFNRRSKKDKRFEYTNFVIMDGFVNSSGARLIDRSNADNSLLLQFCLPMSKTKHPEPFKKPIFKSKNDKGYRSMKAWIESLRGPIHPRYRIAYKPPLGMKIKHDSGALDEKPGETKPVEAEKSPADPNKPAGGDDKKNESLKDSSETPGATDNAPDTDDEVKSE